MIFSMISVYINGNKLHKKHEKALIYLILAVKQLVYIRQLSLSIYCTLIPTIILKMEAVNGSRKWSPNLTAAHPQLHAKW